MITLKDVELIALAAVVDLEMGLPTFDEVTSVLENDVFSLQVIYMDDTHLCVTGQIYGVMHDAILIDRERNRYAVMVDSSWILGSSTGEVITTCAIHRTSAIDVIKFLESQGPKEIIDSLAKNPNAELISPSRKASKLLINDNR